MQLIDKKCVDKKKERSWIIGAVPVLLCGAFLRRCTSMHPVVFVAVCASAGRILSSWEDTVTTVHTNAPVLRWASSVAPGAAGLGDTAVVAGRANVRVAGGTGNGGGGALLWSTGVIRTNVLSSWQGLVVYEGPALSPGAVYRWTAEEMVVAYSNGTAGAGLVIPWAVWEWYLVSK